MSKIEEMIASADPEMRTFGLFLKKREDAEKNLHLDYVQNVIMRNNPDIVIGGSLALFLQDVWLERWTQRESDIDLHVPGDFSVSGTMRYTKKDQSDFDMHFEVNNQAKRVYIDVLIDPYVKYEVVHYKDNQYRVLPLYDVIQAKCRYAAEGKQKHVDDIKEICSAIKVERKELPKPVSWGSLS